MQGRFEQARPMNKKSLKMKNTMSQTSTFASSDLMCDQKHLSL